MTLYKHHAIQLYHEACCTNNMSVDQFIYCDTIIRHIQNYYINVFSLYYGIYGVFNLFFDYLAEYFKVLLYSSDMLQYSYFFVNFLLNRFSYYTAFILTSDVGAAVYLQSISLLDDNITATLNFQYEEITGYYFNYNTWLVNFVGYNFHTIFLLHYCNNFINLCDILCTEVSSVVLNSDFLYKVPTYYLKVCGDRYFFKNATFFFQVYVYTIFVELFFTCKEIHAEINSIYLYDCINLFYFFKLCYFRKSYVYLSFWRTVVK